MYLCVLLCDLAECCVGGLYRERDFPSCSIIRRLVLEVAHVHTTCQPLVLCTDEFFINNFYLVF